MREASQRSKSVLKDGVRGLGGEPGDKTYAAGIEVETGINQASLKMGRQGSGTGRQRIGREVYRRRILTRREAHELLYFLFHFYVSAEVRRISKCGPR